MRNVGQQSMILFVVLLLASSFASTCFVSSWNLPSPPLSFHKLPLLKRTLTHEQQRRLQQHQQHTHAERYSTPFRIQNLATTTATPLVSVLVATILFGTITTAVPPPSYAAPPIAIIAQELGYYPVTNSKGTIMYIPKQISRSSTPQAMDLAQYLTTTTTKRATVYETFWCPHSARQREVFGRQAWALLDHVECSPQGYQSQAKLCMSQKIDGYPTWIFKSNKKEIVLSGEQSLKALAIASGYPKPFDESLELNIPPLVGASSSCQ